MCHIHMWQNSYVASTTSRNYIGLFCMCVGLFSVHVGLFLRSCRALLHVCRALYRTRRALCNYVGLMCCLHHLSRRYIFILIIRWHVWLHHAFNHLSSRYGFCQLLCNYIGLFSNCAGFFCKNEGLFNVNVSTTSRQGTASVSSFAIM